MGITRLLSLALYLSLFWLFVRWSLTSHGSRLRAGVEGLTALISPKAGQREIKNLQYLALQMQEWEDQLGSGQIPDFTLLHRLPFLTVDSASTLFGLIEGVRSAGAPLLPILRRLRETTQAQWETLQFSAAKVAPARGQALICVIAVMGLIPTFEFLLPELQQSRWEWRLGGVLFGGLALAGAIWTLMLADRTRWGGLKGKWKKLARQFALDLEKVLSRIQAGCPPEQAWVELERGLLETYPDLVYRWRNLDLDAKHRRDGVPEVFVRIGRQVSAAIDLSIFEGRPCWERIRNVADGFGIELRAQIQKEVDLLPNQTLKPLFLCVAPSLLGLLAWAMFLTWNQAGPV